MSVNRIRKAHVYWVALLVAASFITFAIFPNVFEWQMGQYENILPTLVAVGLFSYVAWKILFRRVPLGTSNTATKTDECVGVIAYLVGGTFCVLIVPNAYRLGLESALAFGFLGLLFYLRAVSLIVSFFASGRDDTIQDLFDLRLPKSLEADAPTASLDEVKRQLGLEER